MSHIPSYTLLSPLQIVTATVTVPGNNQTLFHCLCLKCYTAELDSCVLYMQIGKYPIHHMTSHSINGRSLPSCTFHVPLPVPPSHTTPVTRGVHGCVVLVSQQSTTCCCCLASPINTGGRKLITHHPPSLHPEQTIQILFTCIRRI